jgi:hypothetical protein
MRTFYDAINPANIPANAQGVCGYIDGLYAWSAADWARFPLAVKVRIAVFASTNDGHVLDCETGDATPAQCPGWVVKRRAAGQDPTVYCSFSAWPVVKAAFTAAKVTEPHYWIAAYPGNGPNLYSGSIAHQYANPGPVDISVVADYWPGVDNSSGVDMDATQDARLKHIETLLSWAVDDGSAMPFGSHGELLSRVRSIDTHTVAQSPTTDAIATATAAKVTAVTADAIAAAVLALPGNPTKEEVATAVYAHFVANPLSLK